MWLIPLDRVTYAPRSCGPSQLLLPLPKSTPSRYIASLVIWEEGRESPIRKILNEFNISYKQFISVRKQIGSQKGWFETRNRGGLGGGAALHATLPSHLEGSYNCTSESFVFVLSKQFLAACDAFLTLYLCYFMVHTQTTIVVSAVRKTPGGGYSHIWPNGDVPL